MKKAAKLEMQAGERRWERANRRGRFQRKRKIGDRNKKYTENVPGLNFAIRQQNNSFIECMLIKL